MTIERKKGMGIRIKYGTETKGRKSTDELNQI